VYATTTTIFYSAIDRFFDLGSKVAIAHNFGIPSTYREIVVLMRKNELICNDPEHRMIGAVTSRNLLSHEYQRIAERKTFQPGKPDRNYQGIC